jgi:hypothetical protein
MIFRYVDLDVVNVVASDGEKRVLPRDLSGSLQSAEPPPSSALARTTKTQRRLKKEMRLMTKSLGVQAFDANTGAYRDPLRDENGKLFETEVSAIQSGQSGAAVSNGNLNEVFPTAGNSKNHGDGAFSIINLGHSTLNYQSLSSKSMYEHRMVFEERFWRCRDSIFFIARRVLGSAKEAEEVVENCFLKASRNPPRFSREGAFGCWLLRILIDEVLLTRHHKKCRSRTLAEQGFSQVP